MEERPDKILNWIRSEFITYAGIRRTSPLVCALLVLSVDAPWTGTLRELLDEVEAHGQRALAPPSVTELRKELRRLRSDLHRIGVIIKEVRHEGKRVVKIDRVGWTMHEATRWFLRSGQWTKWQTAPDRLPSPLLLAAARCPKIAPKAA